MPEVSRAWTALSADTAQVLIIDLQPPIVARSKTIDPKAMRLSAGVLLRLARLFDLPTTFSVAPEGGREPILIEELQGADDFAPQFPRMTASAFAEPKTVDRLRKAARKVLIIAGFATEVAVLHAAIDAIAQGYDVLVPVDACGGMSAATEAAAVRQIEAAGAVTTSVVAIGTKLGPDFATDQGEKMFGIIQDLRLA